MSDLNPIKNDDLLTSFFDRHPNFDIRSYKSFDENAEAALTWERLDKDERGDRLYPYQLLFGLGHNPVTRRSYGMVLSKLYQRKKLLQKTVRKKLV